MEEDICGNDGIFVRNILEWKNTKLIFFKSPDSGKEGLKTLQLNLIISLLYSTCQKETCMDRVPKLWGKYDTLPNFHCA